jgi:gliding motility-associated-like protein
MRPIFFKLFLPVFCIALSLQTYAQTCGGSLGDPVIDENFGSGTNPGLQLGTGVTNMQYVSSNCPNDGQYTISNSITDSTNCHPYTWYDVPHDHTGNPNGYMMIVNADYLPNVFFTQAANGLCPNTSYYFSAYILNLCIPSLITAGYTQPNITFSVETSSGQVLATDTTGTIPPIPYNEGGPKWFQYGVFFTTPVNATDVVVVMTNNAPGGNGNDFVMDDITFRACGPIIQEGFSSTTGPTSVGLCQGSSAIYTMQTKVEGNGSPAYQWQSNLNGNGWVDMPGQNAGSLTVPFTDAVVGVYQYRLGVANGSAITDIACRVYSPPLTINVNALPVVPPFLPQTVCAGHQLQLSATGGATYTWTGPNMAPTQQNPLIINNVSLANAGVYTVVALSDSGCAAAPVNAQVTVIPAVKASLQDTALEICAGESAGLVASGGLYYKWVPATGLNNDTIPNPVATPLQTTTYTVDVSNGGCTDSSKSVTVTVNQNPVADAGSGIILYQGQSAKLNGSIKGGNITNYYWSPVTFLSDPTSLTPLTTPSSNITYTLTAVSATCGTSTSTVFVRVYEKISIPNTFTPNNDGINDYWDIKNLDTYPQSSVLVFDRYGQQVYQSTGYAKPWDGTNNGKSLPAGTYYYIIDLKDEQPKIAGWVLIVK